MIRFGGVDEKGRAIIGLALSPDELKRLGEGGRIVLDGESVGVRGMRVFITTESAMGQLRQDAVDAGAHVQPLEEVLEEMKKSTRH